MANIQSIIQLICIAAIPLIFAITLHEAAHGYIASKLGDHTASIMGRVSLNPIKHIDPIGTVILPLIMLSFGGIVFGWAKPVPVVWRNLRHPRRDRALVAIAGPSANLLMALFWGLVAKVSHIIFSHTGVDHAWANHIALFFHLTARFGIMINCVLLVINLIPIPPLDGSRVISSLLPPALAVKYDKLEWYGLWIFLGLILLMMLTGTLAIIMWPIQWLMVEIYHIFSISSALGY